MKQNAFVPPATRRLRLFGLMTLLLCVTAPAVPPVSAVARHPDLPEGRAAHRRTRPSSARALAHVPYVPQRREDRRVRVFLLEGLGSSSASPTSRLAVEVYRDGKKLLLSPGDELREGDRVRAQRLSSQEFFRGASVVIYNDDGEPAFIVGYHQGVDFTLSKLRFDPRSVHTIKVEITNHSTSPLGIERNGQQALGRQGDSVDIYKEDGTRARSWTEGERDGFEIQTDLDTTFRRDARWIRASRLLNEGREGAKQEYVDVARELERESKEREESSSGPPSDCFGGDSGAASSDRNAHFSWARQNVDQLESNLRGKIDALFNCPSVTDERLARAFADLSVALVRDDSSDCFGDDQGAASTNWAGHHDWAKTKSRDELRANLQWKVATALKCVPRSNRPGYFADLSVAVAKGAGGSSDNGRAADTKPGVNGGEVSNKVIIPALINEWERYDGTVSGTWTLRGSEFHAVWGNGAKAVLKVEQWDNDQVVITRNDTRDSFSKGFTARYTGKLSGNKIVEGKVTWSNGTRSWSGTWGADW